MKKFGILGIALAAVQVCTMHAQTYTTFVSPRLVSTNQQYTEYACKFEQDGLNILVGGLYQQSFKNDRTPALFTPNGTDTIKLDELGGGDINPVWFHLHGDTLPYESTVKFSMKQQSIGLPFMMRKNFDMFFIELDGAFLSVKNDLSVTENQENEMVGIVPSSFSTQLIQNAAVALSNPDWHYGKMVGRPEKKGIDNLQIKFGFNKELENNTISGVASVYMALELPTGTGPTAEYIYEPLVGTTHFGIGAGVGGVLCTCDLNEAGSKFVYDFVYRYQFGARELRSFDLEDNGAWSRYLPLVLQTLNAPTDSFEFYGINELTRYASVQPGHQASVNARFEHLFENRCGFFLNYNFFARGKEQVTNVEPGIGVFGIKDYSDHIIDTRTTSSKARINEAVGDAYLRTGYENQVVDQIGAQDATFVNILPTHLDILSASNPLYLSSTFASGFMYQGQLYFMQAGGSVTVPHSDAAQYNWGVWASAGIHF
jgi:hypothetical protein